MRTISITGDLLWLQTPNGDEETSSDIELNLTGGQLVVAGTGHRPQKLQSTWSQYETLTLPRLTALAQNALKQTKPVLVISGMALGWDTAISLAAINLEIPLIAAVPCLMHCSKWSPSQQDQWHYIIYKAIAVHCPNVPYSPAAMQIRNEWMCDRANRMLALWDGSSGGTANCVKYAKKKGVEVKNLWTSWQKYKGF
jgi:uncharacterized phage-like protein YoqJ